MTGMGRPTPQQAAHPDTQQDGNRAPQSGDKPTRIWVSEPVSDGITPSSGREAERVGTWRADILHIPGQRKPYRVTLSLRNTYARKFWAVDSSDYATEDEARTAARTQLHSPAARAEALRRQARRRRGVAAGKVGAR